MPKPFPYKDDHYVPWNYDISMISTHTGKEEVGSNISSGLVGLTRSGRCYKIRKKLGKGTIEPVRNRVTTEEAEEFLRTIRKVDYSVI